MRGLLARTSFITQPHERFFMRKFVFLALMAPVLAFAGSNVPLELAHNQGFNSCDELITRSFRFIEGNARFNISYFAGVKEGIRLIGTGGAVGDSVYIDAKFFMRGKTCYADTSSTLYMQKSCAEFAGPSMKFVEQSADFTWYENSTGVNLITRQVGPMCVGTYSVSLK